ncbi:hypothetical protein GY45DRAFT_1330262 [Cubamyces sp. BRFM 1775]|nr:hypothetical protein GY45DRAFT_1330262 [Cubamyces sp. BRFM 1775]
MADIEFSQLLFPRHLVLRIDAKGRKKYWEEYCIAVETFLRLKGLEAHLTGRQPLFEGGEKSMAQRQWEAEEKLCMAVITLNIRGTYPDWLKKAVAEKKTAAALWEQLGGGGTVVSGEEDKETKQQRRNSKKKPDNDMMSNAILMCAGFLFMKMLMQLIEKV